MHLIYFIQKYAKDTYKWLAFDLEALGVNILLDRVYFYFRKLMKVFPDLMESTEAHTTGLLGNEKLPLLLPLQKKSKITSVSPRSESEDFLFELGNLLSKTRRG